MWEYFEMEYYILSIARLSFIITPFALISLDTAKSVSYAKSSGSLDRSRSVWDQLEAMYKEMEEREAEYLKAVEIGKMLLDKNKELEDKVAQLEGHFQIEVLRGIYGIIMTIYYRSRWEKRK